MEMKQVKFNHLYLETGDFVRSWDGVGVVMQDEPQHRDFSSYNHTNLLVQHKSGISSNPGNEPKEIPREDLIVISKEDYEDGD